MQGNTMSILFFVFAGLAIAAASQVILAKNAVHAVLSLVLTFFASAVLWLLLEIEFLAMTLVLVYVGAVMVLFLFVVMMLDVELASLKEGFARHVPLGGCVAVLVVLGMVYAMTGQQLPWQDLGFPGLKADSLAHSSQVKTLGEALYTHYLYPLEIAAVLLLAAIVSAISLTFKGKKSQNKAIDPHVQISVSKTDRLQVIKGVRP
jgi:NADH-quinone oxidoreductase subunit J